MSDYAAAINKALGVEVEEQPEVFPHPVCKSQAKRLLVQRASVEPPRSLDLGQVVSGVHFAYQYIVRENGVSGIYPDPGKWGHWHIFFYTDEELRLDQPGNSVQARVDICKKAIDRFLAGTPVYEGIWYLRNLTP